jgi:signal transduction histidine kinase
MTLANFILENMDEILTEWVDFARTISPAGELDVEALRDHAAEMLRAVAADMTTDQGDLQQRAKSRGEVQQDGPDSAAETHGEQRYAHRFTVEELISEYRALRATVIRLWTRQTAIDERTLDELTRFNEGIDQLLAESIVSFSRELDRARHLFMGVLGHDLRTDLQVILSCAHQLERTPSKEQIEKYVPHVRESANNIRLMAEDLLDVARTRLGAQLPIEASHMDLASVCEEVLNSFRQLHAQADIRLQIDGDVSGRWDRGRIYQMLTNLMRNAFQHGDPTRAITVSAKRIENAVELKVHNHGPVIPHSLMAHIFDPMRQGEKPQERTSAGLGLYIASTIAQGHRGTLAVFSSRVEGTTFTATLPTLESGA